MATRRGVLPPGYESVTSMVSVLYNGMLAPIAPLAITGAIWYQGESNAERAYQYRKLLPAMIADWRKLFGQGDFPFYIVGLPAYMHRKDNPGDDSWAEMREAQAMVAKSVPEFVPGDHRRYRRPRQHSPHRQDASRRPSGLLRPGQFTTARRFRIQGRRSLPWRTWPAAP